LVLKKKNITSLTLQNAQWQTRYVLTLCN
jgi:hypothetical protein